MEDVLRPRSKMETHEMDKRRLQKEVRGKRSDDHRGVRERYNSEIGI